MSAENLSIDATVPLPKQTALNVMRTQNVVQEKLSEVLKAYDLSVEQYNVLRILRGRKGQPANMCSIQERMIAKTSNTTRLVDKLLAKELVTREICPDNRRKMEVSITNHGLELLKEVDPKILSHEQALASSLTDDELRELNQLLEKYRNSTINNQ